MYRAQRRSNRDIAWRVTAFKIRTVIGAVTFCCGRGMNKSFWHHCAALKIHRAPNSSQMAAPSQRLATLRAAKDANLHVYVAVAPTYPECDNEDLRATLKAVRELEPVTIFHEPINIRAENVGRMEAQATALGIVLKTEVFATRGQWQDYAIGALGSVRQIAKELRIENRLHLWPDKTLGSSSFVQRMQNSQQYVERLQHWWSRISEWPNRANGADSVRDARFRRGKAGRAANGNLLPDC